jgi:hypothetical protein
MTPPRVRVRYVKPEELQQAAARLHAIRLRKLSGEDVPGHLYDQASGVLNALGSEGQEIGVMVLAATIEWPSERGYCLAEDFSPLASADTGRGQP